MGRLKQAVRGTCRSGLGSSSSSSGLDTSGEAEDPKDGAPQSTVLPARWGTHVLPLFSQMGRLRPRKVSETRATPHWDSAWPRTMAGSGPRATRDTALSCRKTCRSSPSLPPPSNPAPVTLFSWTGLGESAASTKLQKERPNKSVSTAWNSKHLSLPGKGWEMCREHCTVMRGEVCGGQYQQEPASAKQICDVHENAGGSRAEEETVHFVLLLLIKLFADLSPTN